MTDVDRDAFSPQWRRRRRRRRRRRQSQCHKRASVPLGSPQANNPAGKTHLECRAAHVVARDLTIRDAIDPSAAAPGLLRLSAVFFAIPTRVRHAEKQTVPPISPSTPSPKVISVSFARSGGRALRLVIDERVHRSVRGRGRIRNDVKLMKIALCDKGAA